MSYSLIWMPDVLCKAGLTVIEEPGWQEHGHGDMNHAPLGVLLHHTACSKSNADDPSLTTVEAGRFNLTGPLCNLLLARSGTYHCIAAGRAYHAGPGELPWLPAPNTGNSFLIGIEAENDGVGEAWSDTIMDAYVTGTAALLKHLGLPAVRAAGHREYALPKGRKVDPDFDCDAFRLRVSVAIGGLA